jgi:tRNA threonylcarbamoyladenosine biosynthesis protein TsaB
MELAIDTSTAVASLALSFQGEVQAELTWHAGRNHTVELMPNMIHLLHLAKVELGDIQGIIVAKGPGSFTGVRVGMSTAKGLCFALGVPLIGISTLEAAAFAHAATFLPICPILSVGRGEIAAALFQMQGEKWHRLMAEHITSVDALCSEIGERTIFCGEIPSEVARRLKQRLGAKAVILQGGASLRHAGYLAQLGWRRLEAKDFDNLATLQPLYLRKPAVTMKQGIEQQR